MKEDDIRGIDSGCTADLAHRDANSRTSESRGVIDAVTDHNEPFFCREIGDFVEFVLGTEIGMDGGDIERACDDMGIFGVVTGEQNAVEVFA